MPASARRVAFNSRAEPSPCRRSERWAQRKLPKKIERLPRKRTWRPSIPKPPTLFVEAPLPPESQRVTLIDRTNFQCSYVIGNSDGPDTLMCGAPVVGKSLCAYHKTRCWQPREPRQFAAHRVVERVFA
jgi:hypothetical protein